MPISIPAICDRVIFNSVGFEQHRACRNAPVENRSRLRFSTSSNLRSNPTELGRGIESGFTLIELMVVIVIIGLMSAAVVMTVPDQRGRVVDDAERFAARVQAARDNAVLQSRPMSVWVSASGYGFSQRQRGQWTPMNDKPFVQTNWREGNTALVGQAGRSQFYFDSTGLASQPLTIRLIRDGEQVRVDIGVNGKVDVGA